MKDRIDIQIAKLLADNGRMPNAEIARRLNIAESTVRQRVKRLVDSCGLRIHARFDPDHSPGTSFIVVGITLTGLPDESYAAISALPTVVSAFTVTGRYDIIAMFAVNRNTTLREVIEAQLHRIESVQHTETFVVMRGTGMDIRSNVYCALAGIDVELKSEDGPVE